MILDTIDVTRLNDADWSSLIDRSTGIVKSYHDEETGMDVTLHKYPQTRNDDAMVFVSHALSASFEGTPIFMVQLESLDLRLMSSALGQSLKSIMLEYNTRSYLTPARTLLYGNGDREDLGVYLGEKDDESIFRFMEDLLSDSCVSEDDTDYSKWLYTEDDEDDDDIVYGVGDDDDEDFE